MYILVKEECTIPKKKSQAKRKDVAQFAGVSEATVSRVLSGTGPVKEETRRKVLEAAEVLEYYPNAVARNFARRQSGSIGVIMPSMPKVHLFSTYYFSEILSGIGETLRQTGYDMLLVFRSPDEDYDYSMLFKTGKIDACIVLGAQDRSEEREQLRILKQHRYPFCLVNQHFEGESFHNVDADHVRGSLCAMEHLFALGCKRIVFMNGPLRYSNSVERLHGYTLAYEKHGLSYSDPWLLEGNYSRTSGQLKADVIYELIQKEQIDGVFAGNDRMAIGICQGLRDKGVIAGRDYALVGYDDSDASRLCDPALTSVRVPFFDMGKRAVEIVLAQRDSSNSYEPSQEVRLQTNLVVRDSSMLDLTHKP